MPDQPGNSEATRRRQRQAEALRANLKKRKQQARAKEAAEEQAMHDTRVTREPE